MEVGLNLVISCKHASFDEQLATLVKLGIKKTFVTATHPRHAEIMQKITDAGLICENFHASVGGEKDGVRFEMKDLREDDGIKGEYMLELLCEDIDSCARYAVPVLVVHGPGGRPEEEWPDILIQRMNSLMEHAESKGVKIAFENLSNDKNLFIILQKIPNAGFCWDCGHQYCNTPNTRYMQTLGDRVIALHIHDNNGVKREDLHLIPYDGTMDFDEVAMDIAQSGYDGALMLEIIFDKNERYFDQMDYNTYATRAYNAASKIIERVEFFRKELTNK